MCVCVCVCVCVCDLSVFQLCDSSAMNHSVKGLGKYFTQRAIFLYNLFRESKVEAFFALSLGPGEIF